MKQFYDAATGLTLAATSISLVQINHVISGIAGLMAMFYTGIKIYEYFKKKRLL